MGDLTGSVSESSSESDDKDSTLLCLRSELDNTLALRLDVLVLRLETLAALDDSHGGEPMLSPTFFQENSLLEGFKYDSRLLTCFELEIARDCRSNLNILVSSRSGTLDSGMRSIRAERGGILS